MDSGFVVTMSKQGIDELLGAMRRWKEVTGKSCEEVVRMGTWHFIHSIVARTPKARMIRSRAPDVIRLMEEGEREDFVAHVIRWYGYSKKQAYGTWYAFNAPVTKRGRGRPKKTAKPASEVKHQERGIFMVDDDRRIFADVKWKKAFYPVAKGWNAKSVADNYRPFLYAGIAKASWRWIHKAAYNEDPGEFVPNGRGSKVVENGSAYTIRWVRSANSVELRICNRLRYIGEILPSSALDESAHMARKAIMHDVERQTKEIFHKKVTAESEALRNR